MKEKSIEHPNQVDLCRPKFGCIKLGRLIGGDILPKNRLFIVV